MRAVILQLFCIGLALHGLDAQVVEWTAPLVANNVASTASVTTIVTGGTVDDAAALTIIDGVTGAVTTVAADITGGANAAGYTTASTEFAVHATSGAVTVAAAHTVAAATKSSYSLLIMAVETGAAAGVANTGTITITITVNFNPVFSSPTLCWYVADNLAAAQTLGTYSASTQTGETVTYSIGTGNTGTDFSITAAGVLTVSNPMALETTSIYFLQLLATDSVAVAAGIGEFIVVVRVQVAGTATASCSSASSIVGSLLAVIALLMTKFL